MKRKLLILSLLLALSFQTVFAGQDKYYIRWIDDKTNEQFYDVSVTGKYRQSLAREVADIISERRISEGGEAVRYSKTLEKIAMERAAECATLYSHYDPETFTAMGGRYVSGENIQIQVNDSMTAADVEEGWWNSPGHRSNELQHLNDNQIVCVGVGIFQGAAVTVFGFYTKGCDWDYGEEDFVLDEPVDEVRTVEYKTSNRLIVDDITEEHNMLVGETQMNPGQIRWGTGHADDPAHIYLNPNCQIYKPDYRDKNTKCIFNTALGWTSDNPDVVRVDGAKITAVSCGTATLTAHPYAKSETEKNTWTVKINVMNAEDYAESHLLPRENKDGSAVLDCTRQSYYRFSDFGAVIDGWSWERPEYTSSNDDILPIDDYGEFTVRLNNVPVNGSKQVTLKAFLKANETFRRGESKLYVTVYGHKMTKGTVKNCGGKEVSCYKCSVCKRCFKDANAKQSYPTKHSYIYKKAIASTCLKKGMKTHYECEHCGKLLDTKKKSIKKTALETAKKKHSYTKHINNKYLKKKATCTKKAVYYKSCKCGVKTKKKTFTAGKALGHNYKKTVTKSATTLKDGSYYNKCSRCGKKGKKQTITKIKKIYLVSSTVPYKEGATENTALATVKVKTGKKNLDVSKSYYTLKYINNFETGTGKVTVTFKGNYQGTKTLNYKIENCPKPEEPGTV